MKGVVTDGTGKAAALENSEQPVAGKTGTSENYMDSWFCGITPQLSVAIWFGDRSDYSTAQRVPTGMSAASTFPDFMNVVLKNAKVEQFPEAADPQYKSDFKDSEYHIGGYYSSSYDDDESGTTSSRTQSNSNGRGNEGETNRGTTGGTQSGTTDDTGGSSGTGGSTGGGSGETGGGTTGGGSGTGGGTGGSGGESGGGADAPIPVE